MIAGFVCRARRALDHRRNMDEDRIAILDQMRQEAEHATSESDRKFEEVGENDERRNALS